MSEHGNVVKFSYGASIEKEWQLFLASRGEVGRQILEYLRLRFSPSAAATGAALTETARTAESAEVRERAIALASEIADREAELYRGALKIVRPFGRQLRLTRAALQRCLNALDG